MYYCIIALKDMAIDIRCLRPPSMFLFKVAMCLVFIISHLLYTQDIHYRFSTAIDFETSYIAFISDDLRQRLYAHARN